MKKLSSITFIWAMLFLLTTQSPAAGFGQFEMTLEQDCIYTPGKINLTMQLADEVTLNAQYQFRVSIYTAGTLIRQQNLAVVKNQPVNFSLGFPELQSRTEGRCRCELYIGQQFINAQEKPITLWPPVGVYEDENLGDMTIWTYDTSGRLNEIFDKMDVKFSDATFQAVRDFGRPDIVFISQNLDPNNVAAINARILSFESRPMVIWLQQKKLPYSSRIEISAKENIQKSIKFEKNNAFLAGLNERDIMSLCRDISYIKIKNEDIAVESAIYETYADDRYSLDYFCQVEQDGNYSIYCQLPVTDGNPRGILLLRNILKQAIKQTEKISDK